MQFRLSLSLLQNPVQRYGDGGPSSPMQRLDYGGPSDPAQGYGDVGPSSPVHRLDYGGPSDPVQGSVDYRGQCSRSIPTRGDGRCFFRSIGLHRDVWIAAIASSTTSLATLMGVMCNTSQCELRSLRVNSGMLNVIRIVTYYTLPPLVARLVLDCNGVFVIKAYCYRLGWIVAISPARSDNRGDS